MIECVWELLSSINSFLCNVVLSVESVTTGEKDNFFLSVLVLCSNSVFILQKRQYEYMGIMLVSSLKKEIWGCYVLDAAVVSLLRIT